MLQLLDDKANKKRTIYQKKERKLPKDQFKKKL